MSQKPENEPAPQTKESIATSNDTSSTLKAETLVDKSKNYDDIKSTKSGTAPETPLTTTNSSPTSTPSSAQTPTPPLVTSTQAQAPAPVPTSTPIPVLIPVTNQTPKTQNGSTQLNIAAECSHFFDKIIRDKTLEEAQAILSEVERLLKEKQEQLASCENLKTGPHKPVRIYVDGCFDIMHSGHYNALRQAKKLGDILVAGVHSDEEILRNKGPTIFKNEERISMVKACKWVDEIVFDVPYSPSLKLLDQLHCDFVAHGDDFPTTPDGHSAYGEVIKAGRCKIIKRTEGVSTTDLVGRLLLMTTTHHVPANEQEEAKKSETGEAKVQERKKDAISHFLPTTQRLAQFANLQTGKITQNSQVVYVAGSFDLFHCGHVELLEKARALGDFLLVGIHDDQTVNFTRGRNYPIMNLHERVFNVLACKFVDEVIIGAPWKITQEMITSMQIRLVVSGDIGFPEGAGDPYLVPKELGIYKCIELNNPTNVETIVDRIILNRQAYVDRNKKKVKTETEYVEGRKFVEEI